MIFNSYGRLWKVRGEDKIYLPRAAITKIALEKNQDLLRGYIAIKAKLQECAQLLQVEDGWALEILYDSCTDSSSYEKSNVAMRFSCLEILKFEMPDPMIIEPKNHAIVSGDFILSCDILFPLEFEL